jgi:hypothetical protein
VLVAGGFAWVEPDDSVQANETSPPEFARFGLSETAVFLFNPVILSALFTRPPQR